MSQAQLSRRVLSTDPTILQQNMLNIFHMITSSSRSINRAQVQPEAERLRPLLRLISRPNLNLEFIINLTSFPPTMK